MDICLHDDNYKNEKLKKNMNESKPEHHAPPSQGAGRNCKKRLFIGGNVGCKDKNSSMRF